MYDLIVIGGGPGGYMAAERAGHAGLSVLLIEKRALGGVCLNEGCIPSKTLLHSAKVFDYASHGEAYGVKAENVTLDHKFVISRKNKVVETLVKGVSALMKANKVTVVSGEAFITDKNSVKVGQETYSGKRLIIAAGSVPVIPPIDGVPEGIASGNILTSREILDLEEIPKSLVVVGGGVVGLEMASYYNSAGSKVTVVEMLPKIGGPIDSEISAILQKSYERKGIEFKLGARVTAFKGNKVIFDGGEIEAEKVLLSIGRKPLIEGYGLENTGVLLERGAIKTDKHGLTSIPNIYAVGDVNGTYMLAHAAYREAEVAVNHILGKRDIMRYDAVPSVIYTSPEVAGAGETEETAKAKGIDILSISLPMVYSGRYLAENSVTDGICKVLINKNTRNVIGVHMIGSYASEIILSACIMIEMQMRIDDIKEVIFPHPTVNEMIREAIFRL
ncbi:MAG: dihydrolipoyl dehydrogenase [Oscillospiraceae bacterium]|nr:dihydrolipoyl dehydrogenase [Oscillospiraceae bacterium]